MVIARTSGGRFDKVFSELSLRIFLFNLMGAGKIYKVSGLSNKVYFDIDIDLRFAYRVRD